MTDQSAVHVPETATADQFASAFRAFLIALGSYGAGKGWFSADLAQAAIPLIMVVAPVIWAQLKVRSQHAKLVTAANAAPDDVAKVGK